MKEGPIQFLRGLFGRDHPGRSLYVRPEDLFIVSYPRSGNTWMRFLVGNLFYPETPVTFSNLEQMVPDIYQNSAKILSRMPSPRIMKSHEYFDPGYNTVIYMVRDPREVCVSYYYYHLKYRKIRQDYPIERFVRDFIAGDLDQFGPWGEHVAGWVKAATRPARFLLIRYEDLAAEPQKTVTEVVQFFGIQPGQERLKAIVEGSSFSSLQALEAKQSHQWTMTKRSRKDIPFIRAGQIESWKEQLSAKSVELIEAEWTPQMMELGYIPTGDG